mmetsp:Transcript_6641/g.18561  ORF Transcript_6641/g.18561 Transcript_6641/m.18561 type:complete len:86 (+) Transcript_6641:2979-3236(+)
MLSARPLCVWECWWCLCLCELTNPALRVVVEKGWEPMTSPSTIIDESKEERSSSIKASPEKPQAPAIDEENYAIRPGPGVEKSER